MSARSPILCPSPSRDLAAFANLEDQYCRDFSCCGLQLSNLHDLLQHFEECHVRVESDFDDDEDDLDIDLDLDSDDDIHIRFGVLRDSSSNNINGSSNPTASLMDQTDVLPFDLDALENMEILDMDETQSGGLPAGQALALDNMDLDWAMSRDPSQPFTESDVEFLRSQLQAAVSQSDKTDASTSNKANGGAAPINILGAPARTRSASPAALAATHMVTSPVKSVNVSDIFAPPTSAFDTTVLVRKTNNLGPGSVQRKNSAPVSSSSSPSINTTSTSIFAPTPRSALTNLRRTQSTSSSSTSSSSSPLSSKRRKAKAASALSAQPQTMPFYHDDTSVPTEIVPMSSDDESTGSLSDSMINAEVELALQDEAEQKELRKAAEEIVEIIDTVRFGGVSASQSRSSSRGGSRSSTPRVVSAVAGGNGVHRRSSLANVVTANSTGAEFYDPELVEILSSSPSAPIIPPFSSTATPPPSTASAYPSGALTPAASRSSLVARSSNSRAGSPAPYPPCRPGSRNGSSSTNRKTKSRSTSPVVELPTTSEHSAPAVAAPMPKAASKKGKKNVINLSPTPSPPPQSKDANTTDSATPTPKRKSTAAAAAAPSPPPSSVSADSETDTTATTKPADDLPKDPKPYKCKMTDCIKEYKNPGGLKYHMQHAHGTLTDPLGNPLPGTPGYFALTGEIGTPLPVVEEDPILSKPYECTVEGCEKRYKNLNGLKYHIEHAHAELLEKVVAAKQRDDAMVM
ncbi:Transcriptional regulator of ribosomal biogenesis proteins [Chytridiales sp. JEL 0842]|nr:Transcriptional regulator of ribosomal biogenesis proteins [Chytridiales sp. JEL 0842]